VKGLVEGMQVPVDFVTGRQVGKGVIEKGSVLRRGEGFDVEEGLEERRAESAGGAKQGAQPGAEVFVGEVGTQERSGFGWEAMFHVFQKTDQDIALDAGEEWKDGEELQIFHSG
jgi:hypothetical protein